MKTGFFGIAMYYPIREENVGTLWRSAKTYGASFIATVGTEYSRLQASDTTKTMQSVPLLHYTDFDDLYGHLPRACRLIGVELDERSVSLQDYVHPKRALYLMGNERNGIPGSVLERCHEVLQVPTPEPWSLNVSVAGSIVMAHRYMEK